MKEKEIILEIKNLSVFAKKERKEILNNVSLVVYTGDTVSIEGRNGSGKTTLLRTIFGNVLDYDLSGEIKFYPYSDVNLFAEKNGAFSSDKKLESYRTMVSYVRQQDPYDGVDLRVEELVELAIKPAFDNEHGRIKKYRKIKQAVNSEFEKMFETPLFPNISPSTKISKMSGGEKRLMYLYLTLMCRNGVRLLMIDEPLNNLDFLNVMRISNLINEWKKRNPESAVLLVTHCKILTNVNRQVTITSGLPSKETEYVCHHCMGEPNDSGFYDI